MPCANGSTRRPSSATVTSLASSLAQPPMVRKLAAASMVAQAALAALEAKAEPSYDREMAARLVREGAQIGAMTPGQLAGWLAEKVQA